MSSFLVILHDHDNHSSLHDCESNGCYYFCSKMSPRLVTLAFSPYIVVHVNVAYTRLTGFSSAKALGRPLYECLGSQCKEWMDACTATYPVAALQDRSSGIFCTKGNKRNHCRFRTCLVGPPLEGKKKGVDTSVTTHFAISMIPVEPPKEAQAAVRLQKEAPPAITAVAFVHDFSHKQVMG